MHAIGIALQWVLDIASYLILIRVILSWLPLDNNNRLVDIIHSLTEPFIGPIRQITDRFTGENMMIDFSPIIAYFVITLLKYLVSIIFL